MINRCENPKAGNYHRYGGRGIRVCARWREDYLNFIADMGPKPGRGYSLDRIDVDGNYEPGNCRWATSAEQNRNRRHHRYIDCDGKRVTLAEACEIAGIDYRTGHWRLNQGWPAEKVLCRTAMDHA